MGVGRDVIAGQGEQRPVYDSYARLSRVPDTGNLEKIEDQHADNHRTIERLGGVSGLDLSDGMSAWRKGARRKGWEKLLERLESGLSEGVCVYHTDRLFRLPKDLEKLIDLDDAGYRVASAHGTRNLADPDDRYILRIEVAHAARSSDDTSRRTKTRFENTRRRGIPHSGPRRFGFPGLELKVDGQDPEERQQVPVEQVAAERRAIADAAPRLLAGTDGAEIAREWNVAGLRTTHGKTFVSSTVRAVMLRPINAGIIEHDGQEEGRMPGEPIITPAVFKRLRAMYEGRRRGRTPGQVYIGSGIVECGVCQTPVSGRPHNGTYRDGEKRRQYHRAKSRRGCGQVAADWRAVDRELREFVIERLSDSRYAEAIAAARSQVSERLAELDKEIAVCQQLQEALSDRLGRREMSLGAFDKANAPLVKNLAALTAERDALSGGQPEGPVTAQTAEEIAGQWDAATVAERRGMLMTALGAQRLVLNPADKNGKRSFQRERLRVVGREAAQVEHTFARLSSIYGR